MSIIVKTYDIVVDLEPVRTSITADWSSDQLEDLLINLQPIEDFRDFTDGLVILLENMDFVVDKYEFSNRPDSLSTYITCHRKLDGTADTIKCVFRVRVSDHILEKSKRQQQKEYWNNHKETLSEDLKKKIGKWKPKTIIVNHNENFVSYDEVLREVESDIQQWLS